MYVLFPEEANPDGLSTEWLIKNWTKWVWPEGDVNSVLVRHALTYDEI